MPFPESIGCLVWSLIEIIWKTSSRSELGTMSLEYYTVESLGNAEETVKVPRPAKRTTRDNRDMSLEALIQTQIIQQDSKYLYREGRETHKGQ